MIYLHILSITFSCTIILNFQVHYLKSSLNRELVVSKRMEKGRTYIDEMFEMSF